MSGHCAPDVTLYGEFDGDHFADAARIGDVNGDGVPDFAVGAILSDAAGEDSGKAYVYDGATHNALYVLNGEAPLDYFGHAVVGVGDVNGDGQPDFAVDSPSHPITNGFYGPGRVYVYSGPTGELLHAFDGLVPSEFYGVAIDGPGDVDHDGSDDVLIGSPKGGLGNPGRAQLFSGASGGLIYEFTGEDPVDWFGSAVAGVGDLNGDGFPDMLIGAGNHDADGPGPGDYHGRAYLYSGCDGSLLHTFTGGSSGALLGFAIGALGDIDRDGFPDFAIGQIHGNAYLANVYSGRELSILFVLPHAPDLAPLVGIGDIRSAGDFDGDGVKDILIGAAHDGTAGTFGGRTFVFCGGSGRVIGVYTGLGALDFFGVAVDGLGDVNGDGFDDVVIGASNTLGPGYVMVFHGHPVLSADVTGDGVVNIVDLLLLLSQWGIDGQPTADLNQDGIVDECDLDLLLVNWD